MKLSGDLRNRSSDQSSSVLYIVTSAPNNRPWYRRDFLNCLCYPERHRIRFTYDERWIANGVLNLPTGTPAIVIFREDDHGGNAKPRFYPVRRARLIEFIKGGPAASNSEKKMYWGIRFELGPFFGVSIGSENRWFKEWNENIHKALGDVENPYSESNKGSDPVFLFMGPDLKEDANVANEIKWLTLIDEISKTPSLNGCTFFRISSFVEIKSGTVSGRRRPATIPIIDWSKSVAYKLRSGRLYQLELEYYLDPKQPNLAKPFKVKASTDTLKISDPVRYYLGHQAHSVFLVKSTRFYDGETASLIVDYSSSDDAYSPLPEFWVHVRPNRWILPLVALLLSVGSFATLISGATIRLYFGSTGLLGENASIIAGSIRLIGAVLVGVGAYFGFRILTSKGA